MRFKSLFLLGTFFFLFTMSFVSAALNVSLSNQGTDVTTKSTGELLTLGNLTITVWDSLIGGDVIYNETFSNSIVNGSWNVMIGENSSNPLSLEFGKIYYYDYEIDGSDLDFTNFTGGTVERQFFYSPLGDIAEEDISDTTNLTIGEKITFAFDAVIDNIVDGWVRITGGLNVTGDVEINGGLDITGNFSVNNSNLFVDTSTGYVGVGTTEPAYKFQVFDDSQAVFSLKTGGSGDGTWTIVADAGVELSPGLDSIRSMTTFDNKLYVGTGGGSGDAEIYESSDGVTWTRVAYAGDGEIAAGMYNIMSLTTFNNKIYAGTGSASAQVYESSDGDTWTLRTTFPGREEVLSLGSTDNKIYAGTGYIDGAEIHASSDGITWEKVASSGVELYSPLYRVWDFESFGGKIYASIAGVLDSARIYSSDDEGDTWVLEAVAGNGLAGDLDCLETLAIFNNKLYAGGGGTGDAEIYESSDGSTWTLVAEDDLDFDIGDSGSRITSLVSFEEKLYAGTNNWGEIYSSDDGTTWTEASYSGSRVYSMSGFDGEIYAGDGGGAEIYSLGPTDASATFSLNDAGKLVISATGGVQIGSNSLYYDTRSKRYGLNTKSPDYDLDIDGTFSSTGETILARASGNVSIGTTTSTQKLDVDGSVNITGVYYGDGSGLTGLPSGGNSSWNESFANTLYTPNTTAGIQALINSTGVYSTYNATYDAKNSSRWNSDGENISYNDGNVGIGITAPTRALSFTNALEEKISLYADSATARDYYGFAVEDDTLAYQVPNSKMHIFYEGSDIVAQFERGNSLINFGATIDADSFLLYSSGNYRYGFGIQDDELRQFYPSNAHLSIGTISTADGSTFSEKVRIDNVGNVGIGITSPSSPLHINTTNDGNTVLLEGGNPALHIQENTLLMKVNGVSQTSNEIIFQHVEEGTDKGNASIITSWWNGPGFELTLPRDFTGWGFQFNSNAGDDLMFIRYDGDVGIGTTSPTQKLDVDGSVNISGVYYGNGSGLTDLGWSQLTGIPEGFADNLDNDTLYYSGGIYIYKNGSNYFILNETKLNSTIDDLILLNETNGLYIYDNGEKIYLNETKLNETIDSKLVGKADYEFGANNFNGSGNFTTTGRVGIGTASPTEALTLTSGNFLQSATDPTHAGKIGDGGARELSGARSIYVSGKYAYVASYYDDAVEILDISDPSNPTHVGSINDTTCDVANNDNCELTRPYSIYVSGKYAYVISYGGDPDEGGVEILDISDPSNPTHAGSINNIVCDAAVGGAGCELEGPTSIYVSGKYAYVTSDYDNGVEILDISDPTNPTHAGSINDDGSTLLDSNWGIYVSGKYAYVTSAGENGVEILDISDPSNPTHAGSIDDSTCDVANNNECVLTRPRSIYISGKYAYVTSAEEDGVEILDISDPSNPTHVGSINDTVCDAANSNNCELDGAIGIYVSGKYAYVASVDDDGVEILDISDPSNPTHAGAISNSDSVNLNGATSIYVSGKYAYIASSDNNGVEILDISGIDAPAATIGDLAVGTIDVWENAHIANDLYVDNGLVVGSGGIYSQGELSVGNDSYFGGDVNIGGVYYGDGSGLTNLTSELVADSVNTTHILDGTITDADINDSTNLTLGQKMVFALGGFIQNIISGQIDVNGTLNVSDNVIVGGDLNVSGTSYFSDINAINMTLNNQSTVTTTSTILQFKSTVSGSPYYPAFRTADSDRTDDLKMMLAGWYENDASLEFLFFGWDESKQQYEVKSNAAGNGTIRNLSIYAGENDDQLFLNVDGNVGIGTVSPTQKLDVAGSVNISDNLYIDDGAISIRKSDDEPYIDFLSSVESQGRIYGYSNAIEIRSPNGQTTYFSVDTGSGAVFVEDQIEIEDGIIIGEGTKQDYELLEINRGQQQDPLIKWDEGTDTIHIEFAKLWVDDNIETAGEIYSNGVIVTGDTVINDAGFVIKEQVLGYENWDEAYAWGNHSEAGYSIYQFGSNNFNGSGNFITSGNVDVSGDLIVNNSDLFVDVSSGYVGIGKTPAYLFDVKADSIEGIVFNVNRGSQSSIQYFMDPTYTDMRFGGTKEENRIGTWINKSFKIVTNSTSRITIDGAGNVGIGTTNPVALFALKHDDSGNAMRILDSANKLRFRVDQSYDIYMRRSDDVDRVKISADGDSYFNGGDVGIGTTSPTQKLEVNGSVNISGVVYVPEISNPAGLLKIQPDANEDVILFSDADVGDGDDGKEIRVVRNAPEGNNFIRMYVTKSRGGMIHSDADMTFQGQTNFIINSVDDNIFFKLGDSAGSKEVRVRDKLGVDVSTIDSNGNAWFRGDMEIGVDSDVLIQGNGPSYFNGGNFSVNNSDLFVDVSAGMVGIGTDSPEQILHVASDTAVYELENTRSTIGMGYNAGSWIFTAGVAGKSTVGEIRYTATENWNDTSSPTRMQFSTTPVGSTQATTQMTIMPNGSVGIGTAEPQAQLHVNSDGNVTILILQDADGYCEYNPEAGETVFSCSSDKKLKKDIKNASSALEEFEDIQVRDYVVKASGKNMTGVIAQEINETHPEMVHEKDGELLVEVPSSWKLLKAIQELQEMFEALVGGNYSVEQEVVFDEDMVGSATVLANSTFVEVEFVEEYVGIPVVTLTVTGLPDFFYGVDEVTNKSFRILISEVQNEEVVFNWHAFAVVGEVEVNESVDLNLTDVNATINETVDLNVSLNEGGGNNGSRMNRDKHGSENETQEIEEEEIEEEEIEEEEIEEEEVEEEEEDEEEEDVDENVSSPIAGAAIGVGDEGNIFTKVFSWIGGLFG